MDFPWQFVHLLLHRLWRAEHFIFSVQPLRIWFSWLAVDSYQNLPFLKKEVLDFKTKICFRTFWTTNIFWIFRFTGKRGENIWVLIISKLEYNSGDFLTDHDPTSQWPNLEAMGKNIKIAQNHLECISTWFLSDFEKLWFSTHGLKLGEKIKVTQNHLKGIDFTGGSKGSRGTYPSPPPVGVQILSISYIF